MFGMKLKHRKAMVVWADGKEGSALVNIDLISEDASYGLGLLIAYLSMLTKIILTAETIRRCMNLSFCFVL